MAKSRVCVTKITLEYVAGGKVFSIELPPMEIGAIFFGDTTTVGPGRLDMDAAQAAQKHRLKAGVSGARPFREMEFEPNRPLQDQGLRDLDGATSREIGSAPADPGGPSLWWHTNACAWFHPKS